MTPDGDQHTAPKVIDPRLSTPTHGGETHSYYAIRELYVFTNCVISGHRDVLLQRGEQMLQCKQ